MKYVWFALFHKKICICNCNDYNCTFSGLFPSRCSHLIDEHLSSRRPPSAMRSTGGMFGSTAGSDALGFSLGGPAIDNYGKTGEIFLSTCILRELKYEQIIPLIKPITPVQKFVTQWTARKPPRLQFPMRSNKSVGLGKVISFFEDLWNRFGINICGALVIVGDHKSPKSKTNHFTAGQILLSMQCAVFFFFFGGGGVPLTSELYKYGSDSHIKRTLRLLCAIGFKVEFAL